LCNRELERQSVYIYVDVCLSALICRANSLTLWESRSDKMHLVSRHI
jgi:hypothetical protein